jgi:hypothetical protein
VKNYKSKEEAATKKATLELEAVQTTAGLRSATTFLVDEHGVRPKLFAAG